MVRVLFYITIFFFVGVFAPAHARAQGPQNANNFFGKDVVRDVFGDQVEMHDAPEPEYFPRQPDPIDDEEQPVVVNKATTAAQAQVAAEQGAQNPGQNAQENPQIMTALRKEQGKDPVADEIVSKYGDPTKKSQITPVDSAPLPFKGMYAAIDAGRDDLAMMYARQYVGRFETLKNTTRKVMDLTKAAMVAERQSKMMAEEDPPPEEFNQEVDGLMPDPKVTEAERNLEIDAKALALIEKLKQNRDVKRKPEAIPRQMPIGGQENRQTAQGEYPYGAGR